MDKTSPFRPFFICTAIIATLVPMYFVCVLINGYYFPVRFMSEFSWHGHEMIFGLTSALLAGFLLTASGNWTKKNVVSRAELLSLVGVWILGRVILFLQPNVYIMYFSSPFFLLLLLIKMIQILRENRNLMPISLILSVLFLSSFANIYGSIESNILMIERSYLFASVSIFSILYLFSGRLIVFFANSRFGLNLPALNKFVEIATFAICIFSFYSPSYYSLVAAIILLMIRSYNLFNKLMLEEPMLLILFISHIWFVLFMGVRLLMVINPDFDISRPDIHALFAGALASFAFSMMARISLGHSGLIIKASKKIKFAFFLITIGALLRVFLPLFLGGAINSWLHSSMGFWTLGFIIYLVEFVPLFMRKKLFG